MQSSNIFLLSPNKLSVVPFKLLNRRNWELGCLHAKQQNRCRDRLNQETMSNFRKYLALPSKKFPLYFNPYLLVRSLCYSAMDNRKPKYFPKYAVNEISDLLLIAIPTTRFVFLETYNFDFPTLIFWLKMAQNFPKTDSMILACVS